MDVAVVHEVVEVGEFVVVLAGAVIVCEVTVVELTVALFGRYQTIYVPVEGTGGGAADKFGIAAQI